MSRRVLVLAAAAVLLLSSAQTRTADRTLIAPGSTWKYNDTGAILGTVWADPWYNDASWPAGFAQSLKVDGEAPHAHALLKFPTLIGGTGGVPVGAVITSATLQLSCTNPGTAMQMHRLLEDWVEDQAMWSERAPGIPWTSAGVDVWSSESTESPTLTVVYKSNQTAIVSHRWQEMGTAGARLPRVGGSSRNRSACCLPAPTR